MESFYESLRSPLENPSGDSLYGILREPLRGSLSVSPTRHPSMSSQPSIPARQPARVLTARNCSGKAEKAEKNGKKSIKPYRGKLFSLFFPLFPLFPVFRDKFWLQSPLAGLDPWADFSWILSGKSGKNGKNGKSEKKVKKRKM